MFALEKKAETNDLEKGDEGCRREKLLLFYLTVVCLVVIITATCEVSREGEKVDKVNIR